MSVLSFPRLVLNGTTAWNPATNNNARGFGYAKDPVEVALPQGQTYKSYDAWLIELNANGTTNGDWNVYGQMQANFDAAVKTAVSRPGATEPSDPVVGATLRFSGGTPKLVDVNPYSAVTSQVFLKNVGLQGGAGMLVSGPAAARMTSRRPFFGRNIGTGLHIAGGMGVIWQTVIAKADLAWSDAVGDSPTLSALRRAMDDADVLGLMIRVASYTTIYFKQIVDGGWIGQETKDVYGALADKYKAVQPVNVGNIATVFNPAISSLTGAVGLWQTGDAMTVPTDRVLAAQPADSLRSGNRTISLGPAAAKVNADAGCVSFDLLNTIPEVDTGNTKADCGSVEVRAEFADGSTETLGTLAPADYGKDAYEAGGGIVDVPVKGDPARLADARLMLVPDPDTATSLAEKPLVTEVDARSVYVDAGGGTRFDVQVTAGDRSLPAGLKLRAKVALVAQDTPSPVVALTGGTGSASDMTYPVAADGTATVTLTGAVDGNCLVFVAAYTGDTPPSMPDANPNPTTGYAAVRVLPTDDDILNVPDDKLTWDYVYDNVLRPFDLIYRGMSCGVFDLGSEGSVKANASQIASFTDPGFFKSPLYMPITRDLSTGRRKLLLRYLGQDTGAGA